MGANLRGVFKAFLMKRKTQDHTNISDYDFKHRRIEYVDDFVDIIKGYKKLYPDWRIGQIIVNTLGLGLSNSPELFHAEDDVIVEAMKINLREVFGGGKQG